MERNTGNAFFIINFVDHHHAFSYAIAGTVAVVYQLIDRRSFTHEFVPVWERTNALDVHCATLPAVTKENA